MKQLKIFFIFALPLVLFACTEDPLDNRKSISILECKSHQISEEKALYELNSVLKGLENSTTRSGSCRQVADIFTLKVSDIVKTTRTNSISDIENLIYIVNFDNNDGYAILAADDRLEPVIAIVDKGNLTQEKLLGSVSGEQDNQQSPPVLANIMNYVLSSGIIDDRPPIPMDSLMQYHYGSWEDVSKVGPLLTTKWGQDSPFNNELSGMKVGCVAVAMGQMITAEFYKWRNSSMTFGKINGEDINWAPIFESIARGDHKCGYQSEGEKAVASLLKNCGLAVNTVYGKKSSSAYSKDILPVLNRLGFKGVSMTDYNPDIVMAKVGYCNNPVYIETVGATPHGWLIDGVYKQKRKVEKKIQNAVLATWTEERILFHTNFGYEGHYDGYYYPTIFDLKKGPEYSERDLGDVDISFMRPDLNFSQISRMIYYDGI